MVQKNHLLQVLNKEDLEGTALLRIRYTCIVVIHVNVFSIHLLVCVQRYLMIFTSIYFIHVYIYMSLYLQLTGHAQETPAVVGQFHKLVEGLSDAKSTADMVPWC